jgi:GNAT superfamily N-acetyltransferase
MEEIMLNGETYCFSKEVRRQEEERKSFQELALGVFGLSFEKWYQQGYWTDSYLPYTLFHQGRAVANISVNVMPFLYKGAARLYIQLGTVMTAPDYRKRGLSRYLMGRVLEDWKEKSDAIYLFANKTVLDFYPKFGFVRGKESQCMLSVNPNPKKLRKLNVDCAEDRELLRRKYAEGESFSKFSLVDNWGLLMFHCAGFVKNCIYYLEEKDVAVIADYHKEQLCCYHIFGKTTAALEQILNDVSHADTRQAVLYFSPVGSYPETDWQEEDDTLFVYGGKENLFQNGGLLFPLLSHA